MRILNMMAIKMKMEITARIEFTSTVPRYIYVAFPKDYEGSKLVERCLLAREEDLCDGLISSLQSHELERTLEQASSQR